MDGTKTPLTKEEQENLLWKLDYVANSIKTYGSKETFDRPFYSMHLKQALEILEGDKK